MTRKTTLYWLGSVFRLWMITTVGIVLAALPTSAIAYDSFYILLGVGFLLSLFNLFLKPLLIFFTLPFVLLTLGAGILLINAFLFMLAGKFFEGFSVVSFWSALWGAFIIGVITFIFNALFIKTRRSQRRSEPILGEYIQFRADWRKSYEKKKRLQPDDDDVINI